MMTSHSRRHPERSSCDAAFNVSLYSFWMVLCVLHAAPTHDFRLEDQQEERWLSDESFYELEYVGDQPMSDGVKVVSNDLCPPVPSVLPVGGCEVEQCSSDRECASRRLKCCYNGCVYTCLPEVKPPAHFDWMQEPRRRLQFGQSWLIPGPDQTVDVEMCSTTPLDDDSDPLVCPHGYECSIDDAGNPEQGFPNSGHCVKINDVTPDTNNQSEETSDTASTHACHIGEKNILLSGHSIVIDGKTCRCNDTKLVCEG